MFDPGLAERLREMMDGMFEMESSHMFGGFGYLMNGNMCVFIWNDSLVIRIGTDAAADIMDEPHVGPMDLTGRVMRGWAVVHPEGIAEDRQLLRYVDLAIFFCAGLPPKEKKR